MPRKIAKYGFRFLAGAVLFLFILYGALNFAVSWPRVRDPLLRSLDSVIGYRVETRDLSFALWPRPHIRADKVVLRKLQGGQTISLKRLGVRFNARELLSLKFTPSEIRLVEPVLELSGKPKDESEKEGTGGLPMGGWPGGLDSFSIVNGTIRLSGHDMVEALNVTVLPMPGKSAPPLNVSASARLYYKGEKIPARFVGRVRPGEDPRSLPDWNIDGHFSAQDLPLKLATSLSAFENMSGLGEADIQARGSWGGDFQARGVVRLEDLRFRYVRSHGAKDYDLKYLTLDFDGARKGLVWDDPNIRVRGKDLDLRVKLKLDFGGPDGPIIDATGNATEMPMRSFMDYFPSPNLPPLVTDRILNRAKSGSALVNLLRINGTLHQIDNAGDPKNGSVVTCDIAFRDLESDLSGKVWPVKKLAAVVSYADGNLDIHDVSFRFGKSETKNLRIFMQGILGGERRLDIGVQGDYLLEDLVRQTGFEEVPRLVKSLADDFKVLTGSVRVNLNAQHTWNQKEKPLLWGVAHGKNVFLERDGLNGPVSLEQADVRFTREGHAILDAKGTWNDIGFTMRSDSLSWTDPVKKYSASFDASIDIKRMMEIVGADLPEPLVVTGALPVRAEVKRRDDEYLL